MNNEEIDNEAAKRPPDLKRVLHAGHGLPIEAKDGDKVIFNYRAEALIDNSVERLCLDDSRKSYPDGYGKPMELIFGKKFRLLIWETCLRTMRVDEVAEFVLPPGDVLDFPFVSKQLRDIGKKSMMKSYEADYHDHNHHSSGPSCMGMAVGGLGYKGLDDWLQKPVPIVFTFHLLKLLSPQQYERESWTLNAAEKLGSLEVLKTEGNTFFAQCDYAKAFERYCEALSRLDSLMMAEKPGEPEHIALDQRKTPLYNNAAECKLKLREFYPAIEACDEALAREPHNVKALFRRARAHTGAWNLGKAKKDYEKALQLDPSLEKSVRKELEHLKVLELEKKKSDAEIYKKVLE